MVPITRQSSSEHYHAERAATRDIPTQHGSLDTLPEALAEWLDESLERLEERFRAFKTQQSVSNSIGRQR